MNVYWEKRDKKPLLGSRVLVYNGSVYMADIGWDAVARPVGFSDTDIDDNNKWTHWMPLPEPPEE